MIEVPRGLVPDWLDVSRETLERLEMLLALVEKWTGAINLVAPASLPQAWTRHVLDSAQLFALSPAETRLWADLGSGGGFPGLVVAALARQHRPGMAVALVESDRRKAAFLSLAARELGLGVTVHAKRAEALPPLAADVVSARALAPLGRLCGLAARHLAGRGLCLFPKGQSSAEDLAELRKTWKADIDLVASKTDPAGQIVVLRGLQHA